MAENTQEDFTVELLPFDTEIFGIKCGIVKINNKLLSKDQSADIINNAKEKGISHLVVKIPTEWVSVCSQLENLNFRFKLCSLELEKFVSESDCPKSVELYERQNDQRLVDIAEKSFASATRFHFEERFTRQQVSEVYKRWISNLICDRDVRIYVHFEKEIITGFITVKIIDAVLKTGHIGLFAVDKTYQGKGIGSKLLSAAGSSLFNKAVVLNASTECINYAALKTYQKGGFHIKQSWNVFHCNVV